MLEQLPLLEDPTKRPTIAARFALFHAANPEVYAALVEVARAMHARGVKRMGIALLFERLRWLHFFETHGDTHKLPNDFRAEYARLIMAQETGLADFFEIRKLRRNH